MSGNAEKFLHGIVQLAAARYTVALRFVNHGVSLCFMTGHPVPDGMLWISERIPRLGLRAVPGHGGGAKGKAGDQEQPAGDGVDQALRAERREQIVRPQELQIAMARERDSPAAVHVVPPSVERRTLP